MGKDNSKENPYKKFLMLMVASLSRTVHQDSIRTTDSKVISTRMTSHHH